MIRTEMRNPRTTHIDRMTTEEMVSLIAKENYAVVKAVEEQTTAIAAAVDAVSNSFSNGGRLFFIGAGTSGRLGVLDAAECPPTFGVERDNVSAADEKKLQLLITAYGERHAVISALEGECAGKELDELKALSKLLDLSPDSDKIRFDFSVVNNMSYYNGFVFRGFLDGVCDGVLAGGQYDRLMAKMNRKSGAVGFAIYLDELEQLQSSDSGFDIDVLVLYDDSVSAEDVAKAVAAQATLGKSVSAQKCVSDRLRAKETVDIRREGAKC